MYSQLSGNQTTALETGKCPHCQANGTMRKIWTRNGDSVQCTSCKKKVYKPRGRAVAKERSNATGAVGAVSGLSTDDTYTGNADSESSNSESNGQGESNGESNGTPPDSQSTPSQAASKLGQQLGKPLSQAAQDAMAKIENTLRQEMRDQLARQQKQLQDEKEKAQQELQEQVNEQVESLRPTQVEVKVTNEKNEVTTNIVPNPHKLLAEVLEHIRMGFRNFLFIGPSGSGKTTLARQIAMALALPYGILPWSGDTTPGAVLGRPSGDGQSFFMSPWLKLYSQASVFLHDELDAADPNVPICMNAAIENGEVFLPSGHIIRHPMHIVLANGNTWGIGADMLYCGRNQLDAAVKDRFVGGCFICDYDSDLEAHLVPEQEYREAFWQIRAKIFEHKLRRVWGTRALCRGALFIRDGKDLTYTFRRLTVGFSPDELSKIGVA